MQRALVLCVLSACGRVGFDPPASAGSGDSGGSGDARMGDGGGSATIDAPIVCTPLVMCPDLQDSLDDTSKVVDGQVVSFDHGLHPSCGGENSGETTLEITTTGDGPYEITYQGDAGGLSMYVLDECCAGPELACADIQLIPSTKIMLDRKAGQKMIVVIEHAIGESAGATIRGLN